jgi:hypothetical protein
MPQPSCTLQAGVMVNCFLLMVSGLRGVPPVSLQPGIQLCRRSSEDDGGLSLGPPKPQCRQAWAGAYPPAHLFVRCPRLLVPNALLSDWAVCLTLC